MKDQRDPKNGRKSHGAMKIEEVLRRTEEMMSLKFTFFFLTLDQVLESSLTPNFCIKLFLLNLYMLIIDL